MPTRELCEAAKTSEITDQVAADEGTGTCNNKNLITVWYAGRRPGFAIATGRGGAPYSYS
jgi:hypothetical protein